MWVGFASVEVPPSPNDHSYATALVDWFRKPTVRGPLEADSTLNLDVEMKLVEFWAESGR